jgi:hypothetical protein
MTLPSVPRLITAGLAGGAVLNLIDTPWSIWVMVPRLHDFNTNHQLSASALTGPWFLLTHFAFVMVIAWLYALARQHYGPGPGTALRVAAVMVLINRAFGVGNALLGWIPAAGLLGFSLSFVLGVLLASVIAARVVDASVVYRRPAPG